MWRGYSCSHSHYGACAGPGAYCDTDARAYGHANPYSEAPSYTGPNSGAYGDAYTGAYGDAYTGAYGDTYTGAYGDTYTGADANADPHTRSAYRGPNIRSRITIGRICRDGYRRRKRGVN